VAEPARAPRRRKPAPPDRLSARERQVLALLPRGLTNAGLGAELGISTGTAKVHVERILQKLQLSDRTQAAVYAVQAGMAL
jgi:DNA-binding NarL/FixJ family response regulator